MTRNTAFHAVLANNAYVVSCYYHNGSTTTPYKGDDLERALSVYVKYADVNRKVSKTSAPLYDVTLYQSGEKAMHDIVHDFPASKENFSN